LPAGRNTPSADGRLGASTLVVAAAGEIWQDPGMRLLLVVAVPLWMTAGCSPSHASERASDGTLLLEVGGGHASLRGSLQAAGVEVAAPQTLQPAEPVASLPPGQPIAEPDAAVVESGPQPQPVDDSPPRSEPPVAPRPSTDYFVVTLGPRQNLIQLAKKHLGNGNRFREIMALNGWSEADTRRLQAGQKVKIPRPPTSASPNR
jgi:hypothetical protein